MRSLLIAGLLGLLTSAAVAGCALEPSSDAETASTDGTSNTGTVRLDLQGTTAAGTVYRLRNATFTISTNPPITLSSDGANANATVISQALTPGSYSITLQNGWVLDRVNAQNVGSPVVATLVSSSSLMFGIQAGVSTPVTFQFQTNGQVVTTGTLNVGIGVTELDGGAGQNCTPFANPPSCPAPLWCGPATTAGSTQPVCQAGGNVPVNSPCTSQFVCAANLLCTLNPTIMAGLCKPACSPSNPNSCPNGGLCTPLNGSMLFGTCP